MKKISLNIPSETVQQIEWLKVFMQEIAPIKYTTTDIIRIAVDKMYKSNKTDTNSK